MPYRTSPIRHPLKRVRSIVGMDGRTLAARVGVAPVTVKRVEQRTLKMSQGLALRVQDALGVSAAYLMHGDSRRQPTTPEGAPFTRESFEMHEASRKAGQRVAAFFPFRTAAMLGAVASAAGDKGRLVVFNHKVFSLLAELAREFGQDNEALAGLETIVRERDLGAIGAHDRTMSPAMFERVAAEGGAAVRVTVKRERVRAGVRKAPSAVGVTAKESARVKRRRAAAQSAKVRD